MADYDSKTAQFLQWFKAQPGATFSDAIEIVDLRQRNAGRGIVAKADIPADTTLFSIPRQSIISSETSSLRQALPDLFESRGDEDDQQALDSWTALILVMVYEFLRGTESQWKPYLEVLPDSFDTPMFWSDAELAQLQASATVAKIGKEQAEDMFRAQVVPCVRAHTAVFAGAKNYSDDEIVALAHKMGSTIMAYAFDLENDEEGDGEEDGWVEDREGKTLIGMVPMADILNADAEFNAHVNHGDDALTVTSLRDIKAGEEILNYYGPHPNSELLRRYGYVTERHARYDVVEVPWALVLQAVSAELGIPEDAVLAAAGEIDDEEVEDTFVLERETGEPTAEGLFAGPAGVDGIPVDLKDQLKALLKLLQKRDASLVADKRKRDDAMVSITVRALQAVKAAYETSVAEDVALLGHESSRRAKMAISVRLGEKRLLDEAINALGQDSEGSNKRVKR